MPAVPAAADATRWVAYTDGACAPSNPGPAAWGAVILGPGGREPEHARGFIGHGTNQIAEIVNWLIADIEDGIKATLDGLDRPGGGVVDRLLVMNFYDRTRIPASERPKIVHSGISKDALAEVQAALKR
jgi:hypothetical protein